jgi:hypothetical protein
MKMKKNDLIKVVAGGFLILALIFFIFGAVRYALLKKAAVKEGMAYKPEKVPGSGDLFLKLEAEAKQVELKRDPFTSNPVPSVKASAYGVQLSGIVWDKDKPMAIINGRVVKVGDNVDGRMVSVIKQDRVVLNDGISEIELKLGR